MVSRITLPTSVVLSDLGTTALVTFRDQQVNFTAQHNDSDGNPVDLTGVTVSDFIVFGTVDVNRDALDSIGGLSPINAFSNLQRLADDATHPVKLVSSITDATAGTRSVTLPPFLWREPIPYNATNVPCFIHTPYLQAGDEAYSLGRGLIVIFEASPEPSTARNLS